MERADPVDALGQPHPHHGHVEPVGAPAVIGLSAERQDLLERQPGFAAVLAELGLDQGLVEPVDPRRNGRVRGEDGSRPRQLDRLGEGRAVGQVLPDPLDAKEAGVALVGVEDLGPRVPGDAAVQPHRPQASDAEQQFLAQPVIAAAPVEPVGDLTQQGVVVLGVGVEEQQRDPAHVGDPDLRR